MFFGFSNNSQSGCPKQAAFSPARENMIREADRVLSLSAFSLILHLIIRAVVSILPYILIRVCPTGEHRFLKETGFSY